MPRSVNKVTLIGTLGRDPEVRFMPNGNAVANLSLATDESYNDKQTGQKVEKTEWHRIVVFGKLAEIIQQYLKKGAKAYFEGKLQTREYEKDGIKRYTTEIVANDMVMLDSRSDNQGMTPAGFQPASQMMNPNTAPMTGMNAAPQQAQGGYQAPQQAQVQAPQQQAPQQAMSQPTPQPGMNPAPGYPQQAAPQQQSGMVPQQAPQQGGYQQAPQQPQQQAPQAAPQPSNSFDNDFDDDIPF